MDKVPFRTPQENFGRRTHHSIANNSKNGAVMVAQRLSKVQTKGESAYVAFYYIPLHTSANFFLSSSISDKSSAAERNQGVVYFREDGDDIDISVILSDKIIESLEQLDPHEVLNNSNLNAFCVVV